MKYLNPSDMKTVQQTIALFLLLVSVQMASAQIPTTSGYNYDPVYFRKKDRKALPKIEKIVIDTTGIPRLEPKKVEPNPDSKPNNGSQFEGGGVALLQTNSAARRPRFYNL